MRGLIISVSLALLTLGGPLFAQPDLSLPADSTSAAADSTQQEEDRPQIEFMHPETVYAFRGLDGKGFLQRKPINIPEPAYDRDKTGLVIIIFTITSDGSVKDITLEPGQEDFATATQISSAKQAIRQWKFNPLPEGRPQADEKVRVLIQFNYKGSGRIYSTEGNFILEGIAERYPTHIPSPQYEMRVEGTVTAEIIVEPTGEVAWVDRYYGETPQQPVNPHLGIITHEAVQKWRFIPVTADMEQKQTRVKVICRYFHWPDVVDPHVARKGAATKQ